MGGLSLRSFRGFRFRASPPRPLAEWLHRNARVRPVRAQQAPHRGAIRDKVSAGALAPPAEATQVSPHENLNIDPVERAGRSEVQQFLRGPVSGGRKRFADTEFELFRAAENGW